MVMGTNESLKSMRAIFRSFPLANVQPDGTAPSAGIQILLKPFAPLVAPTPLTSPAGSAELTVKIIRKRGLGGRITAPDPLVTTEPPIGCEYGKVGPPTLDVPICIK